MKPIQLKLSGWGPFKDVQYVDFSGFTGNRIFLITGRTGAGKTTIFDALTYALYGSMSGEMREKNSVRSDFADADTQTYVELTMQHDGRLYEIYRNPEYLRPKKRKNGASAVTKERERAVLTMPDGTKIEGSGEVTRKVQEILRLDYRQFKQISMIAQGEFARLLTAPSGEKTKIFREIFDTAVYDRFAGILREEANALYKEVMEYRHRMDEDIRQFGAGNEQWNELAAAQNVSCGVLLPVLKQLKKEYQSEEAKRSQALETLDAAILKLSDRIGRAEQIHASFVRLAQAKARREQLLLEAAEKELLQERVRQARQAQRILPDKQRLLSIREQLKSEEEQLQKQITEAQTTAERLQELENVWQNRENLRSLLDTMEKLAASQKDRQAAQAEEAGQEKRLAQRRETYLSQEKERNEKLHMLNEAQLRYRRAVIGIAASMLEEGKPCPVCGSIEHPLVAEEAAGVPDEQQLHLLQEAFEESNRRLSQLHADAAAAAESLRLIQEQGKRVQEAVEEQEHILAAAQPRLSDLAKTLGRSGLQEKTSQYTSLLAAHGEQQQNVQQRRERTQELGIRLNEAVQLWHSALSDAGFRDAQGQAEEAGYERAFLPESELTGVEKVLENYRSELAGARELVKHLEETLEGSAHHDTQPWKQQLEQLQADRREQDRLKNNVHVALAETQRTYRLLAGKQESMQRLEETYGVIRDLDNLASGSNGKRLVFEQYVLAGYFDDILEAANIRLRKMSGGRYELSRVEEAGDGRSRDSLEIRVMDYYTGRERSVRTLSGGECFKASLSLALGTSDVVQAESGGIRVDTLFVDEGFGSLDGESLDQACAALMNIGEGERLIGIISHVPELKERISSQIHIEKKNTGSVIHCGEPGRTQKGQR